MSVEQCEIEAVFTEVHTLDQWTALTESQRAAWLTWIDAGDLGYRRARAYEASNRFEAGQMTPPAFGAWQKVKILASTVIGFFSG